MNFRNTVRRSTLAALALVLSGGASLQAQDLPDAKDLLARYREAIGGTAAMADKQSVHSVGEFSVPAAGLVAQFEAYSARPNRSATKVPIPGFGEFLRGFTGDVAWSVDPMEGPRLLQGPELAEARDEAAFESSLRPDELVESVTTVERTTLAGRECYKVRVAWKSGRETFDCFSPESGLLVGSMSKQHSAMGVVDAVALYDEYRDFGGVRMASRITVQILGNEQVVMLREVRFNEVPDSAFEPPTEIRALIRQ
ncbi:hypothetical protein BH23GEM9_BH23GEM9_15510 [soil metagenome]